MEVDMNKNIRLFYCSPDILMSVKDIHNLEIGIQSEGYEELNRDSNLLNCMWFLGKATNSSNINYKLHIEELMDGIVSKGIKLIKSQY